MSRPIDRVLSRLEGVRRSGDGWVAKCPGHDDREASLSIKEGQDGRALLNCFAGCHPERIVAPIGLSMRDLFPDDAGLTVEDLSRKKGLPLDFLKSLGLRAAGRGVLIPYRHADGTEARPQIRWPQGHHTWAKPKSAPIVPYGLDRLSDDPKALCLVEGCSDAWTLWHAGIEALGIPGAEMLKVLQREHLHSVTSVYVVEEDDRGGATFRRNVDARLQTLGFKGRVRLVSMVEAGANDPSALHLQDRDGFGERFRRMIAEARPLVVAATPSDLIGAVTATPDARLIRDNLDVLASLSWAEVQPALSRLAEVVPDLNQNEIKAQLRRRKVKRQRDEIAADGKPLIELNDRHSREVIADCLDALRQNNEPPTCFLRDGRPVQIGTDEHDRPRIVEMNEAAMANALGEAANFVKSSDRGVQKADLTQWMVRRVMETALPFPPIVGITEVPVLRPDGTVFDQPGYDPQTRLVYRPSSDVPEVPVHPTEEDVIKARSLLSEMLYDFPFADRASAANTFGLLLTVVCRSAIDGNVPLAAIDAPTAGTGKTKLAEGIARVVTGKAGATFSAPRDDEEWRKKITAVLLQAIGIVIVDNVVGTLSSPELDRALTSAQWGDRRLGKNESIEVPQRAVFIATGNNLRPAGDTIRRCYLIRLDAKVRKPWERNGFRHPNLEAWITEHRGALVHALLVLARAWYSSGCPTAPGLPHFGSFEQWARIVGGILHTAGIRGFLTNQDTLVEQSDDEGAEWAALLEQLHAYTDGGSFLAGDIARDLKAEQGRDNGLSNPSAAALLEAMPDHVTDRLHRGRSVARTLGSTFANRRDRRYAGGWYITEVEQDRSGSKRWIVRRDAADLQGLQGSKDMDKTLLYGGGDYPLYGVVG